MEIVYYLPVNRITVLSQRLFLSYIKNKEKNQNKQTKNKNSIWGVTLVFPDSQAYGLVPVSTSSPYVSGWNYLMQL